MYRATSEGWTLAVMKRTGTGGARQLPQAFESRGTVHPGVVSINQEKIGRKTGRLLDGLLPDAQTRA